MTLRHTTPPPRARLQAALARRFEAARQAAAGLPLLFQRLRCWRRRLATAAVALLACLIGLHTLVGENGVLMYMEKRAEYRRLEQEIESLQRENERLGREIRSLRTDPRAIEREAREQLRYARPGEVVYILPPPPASAVPPAPPATAERR